MADNDESEDDTMERAMIGLGRMGSGITGRLVGRGHTVVGCSSHWGSVKGVFHKGAEGASSLAELSSRLPLP